MIPILSTLLVLAAVGADTSERPKEEDFYRIVTLPIPDGVVLEVGALEWAAKRKLAVSSRRGEIYLVENPSSDDVGRVQFRKFADGLHEVLGLASKGDWLYATQRCEVTRLRDEDGDGRADLFETVNDDWEISGDYHEYAFGSKFDRDGNLWVVLCLTGSFTSDCEYRGWCLRISADGKMVPTCSGLRSPGGVGFNAQGDAFFTENQGPWNGTCSLKHLKPGSFLGHPAGNRWYEITDALGPRPADPKSGSRMAVESKRIPELVPPAVLFPYDKMGKSASGILCDLTGGKFGPFAGQMFVGDQSASTVMRVFLEQVDGVYQGVCFPFRQGFASGTLALLMSDEGSMFVGGTNRGWGSVGTQPYALERLEWTGRTPFEIHEMRAKPDGFELTFTQPVDPKSAAAVESYKLTTYTYIYQENYGSPEVDHTTPVIRRATVGPDNRSVRLVVDKLAEGHVHELHSDGVLSASMQPLLHTQAYYTLNKIPDK